MWRVTDVTARARRPGFLVPALVLAAGLQPGFATRAAAQIVIRGGVTSSVYTERAGFSGRPDVRRGAVTIGAGIAIPVQSWLQVYPEVSWVPRGGRRVRLPGPADSPPSVQSHRIDGGYLDFAVLGRAFAGSVESVRVYGAAGPTLSFLASCSVETAVDPVEGGPQLPMTFIRRFTGDCDKRPLDPVHLVNLDPPATSERAVDDIDLGFVVAVGLDVALPGVPGSLNIEGRFVRGFQSAFEDLGRFSGFKNTLYAVTVGYGFHPP